MAKSRKGYRRGGYNYTPRRAQALRKAQAVSARKRKIRYAGAVAGGVLGVAGAAYLGHRHGGKAVTAVRAFKPAYASMKNKPVVAKFQDETSKAFKAYRQALINEKSKNYGRIKVPTLDSSQQKREMGKITRSKLAPHLGGPDYRVYNEDKSVNTEAMTNRRVAGTLRAARRKTRGKRTKSKARVPAALKQRGGRTNVQQAALEQWIKDYG